MAESTQSTHPVVVGTDVQSAAKAAAIWAGARALALGEPLTLVASAPGVPMPSRTSVYDAMRSSDYSEQVKGRVAEHLEIEAQRVRDAYPGLVVETLVAEGDAAGVLVELSRTARFTVIGTHGKPEFADRILGSTAEGVVSNAFGTVVAVPPDGLAAAGPVVVGIDDPSHNPDVLRVAHVEAQAMGKPLVVLHIWQELVFGTPFDLTTVLADPDVITAEAQRVISEAMESYRDQFPQVETSLEVAQGFPRDVLVQRSRSASALVIGARGKGGFLGLLLGSTSRAVVRNAHCPVIVVRPRPS